MDLSDFPALAGGAKIALLSQELEASAPRCSRCDADFGPYSSWVPSLVPPKESGLQPQYPKAVLSSNGILLRRIAGTIWLLVALAITAFAALAMGLLSFPFGGLGSSPMSGPRIFLIFYLVGIAAALIQLWRGEPFTTFFLIVAVLPLGFQFIIPLLAIASLR